MMDDIEVRILAWVPSGPAARREMVKRLDVAAEQPEVVKVSCDVHGWMGGWFIVEDNPYYAKTDANGAYKLTDVPPGDYEVKVWHEKLGEKTQKVTVTGGGESKANFELATK